MLDMIQTVIISCRLVPAEGETLDRVRSVYVNDFTNPHGVNVRTVIVRHDPKAALPELPVGLEAHEVPLTVGETRVQVTHLERTD